MSVPLSLRRRTHAVVLAGGAGERFWPRSRRRHPKPLLAIGDRMSLLGATVERARRCAPADQVWLVCGAEHAAAMRRDAKLPAARTLVEPLRRNTTAAIALAATRIAARDPDALLVVLPADHRIRDGAAFARAIARALRAADEAQVLVTLGVTPCRPDTGFTAAFVLFVWQYPVQFVERKLTSQSGRVTSAAPVDPPVAWQPSPLLLAL